MITANYHADGTAKSVMVQLNLKEVCSGEEFSMTNEL